MENSETSHPIAFPVYLLFIDAEGDPDSKEFKHNGIMQAIIGGENTCIQLFTDQQLADQFLHFLPPSDHHARSAYAIHDPMRLLSFLEDAKDGPLSATHVVIDFGMSEPILIETLVRQLKD